MQINRMGNVCVVVMVVGMFFSSTVYASKKCSNKNINGFTPVGVIPFPKKSDAMNAARQNWVGACISFFGGPANTPKKKCDWVLSANKKSACNRVPNGFGGYNYTCEFRARPCWNAM